MERLQLDEENLKEILNMFLEILDGYHGMD